MNELSVVFFGSTQESLTVLSRLAAIPGISVKAVVTQPPRPVGRHQEITPTPVERWSKQHGLTVLSFPTDTNTLWLFRDEQTVVDAIQPLQPDLLVTASFGQKIPTETINEARFGGLNVHPSLLPRWRGADPVPWAIMTGDHQTGVTIVTLAENFDEGKIIAQKKIPILPTDTTETLYPKLFIIGADLLIQVLATFKGVSFQGSPQGPSPTPYARRLTKQDGFISWEIFQGAMGGEHADEIDRKFRAFFPWPGLWTQIIMGGVQKRLKILKLNLREGTLVIDTVQIEGKNPTHFSQFQKAYSSII